MCDDLQQLQWLQSLPAWKIKAMPAGMCTEKQQVTLLQNQSPLPSKSLVSLHISLELGSEVL